MQNKTCQYEVDQIERGTGEQQPGRQKCRESVGQRQRPAHQYNAERPPDQRKWKADPPLHTPKAVRVVPETDVPYRFIKDCGGVFYCGRAQCCLLYTSDPLEGRPEPPEEPPEPADLLHLFHPVCEFQEEEATWLIPGWIPESQITLIAADGGIGKTTLWINIVAALSAGKPCILDPPDHTRKPQKVAFCTTEDSVRTVSYTHLGRRRWR